MKKTLLTCTAIALALGTPASKAMANSDAAEIALLKEQISLLMQKVEQLEENQQASVKPGLQIPATSSHNVAEVLPLPQIEPSAGHAKQYVEVGDVPGSIKIPGTDTSLKIGGFVKVDAVYDIDGATSSEDFLDFNNAPLENTARDDVNNFKIHARQSRFNIGTYTPTDKGTLKTFFEGDFYGSNDGFRIRHAYGELGSWLIGQTWTNFAEVALMPGTLDFDSTAALNGFRFPQIRYTHNLTDNSDLIVSLESPSSSDLDANNISNDDVSDTPTFTAKYLHTDDWGRASIRGLVREMEVLDGTTGKEESEMGYGLAAGFGFNLFDSDYWSIDTYYGDGLGGEYLYGSNGGSVNDAQGLQKQEAWGVGTSYLHKWNDSLSSYLAYGYVETDNDPDLGGTANKWVQTVHTNLLWDVTTNTRLGVEYSNARREVEDGREGETNRLQFSAYYFF